MQPDRDRASVAVACRPGRRDQRAASWQLVKRHWRNHLEGGATKTHVEWSVSWITRASPGHHRARQPARPFAEEFPDAPYTYTNQLIEGRIASWHGHPSQTTRAR